MITPEPGDYRGRHRQRLRHGQTYSSTDFTTLTPMRPWAGAPTDAFIAKLNPNGTAMLNFTYLGGSSADGGNSIALDKAGNIYLTGYTASTNFPPVNAFQNTKAGGTHDAFVAKIDAAWSGLVYSTYLGGSLQDSGQKIGVDVAGCAYVMGATQSGTNFPTKNSLQPYRGDLVLLWQYLRDQVLPFRALPGLFHLPGRQSGEYVISLLPGGGPGRQRLCGRGNPIHEFSHQKRPAARVKWVVGWLCGQDRLRRQRRGCGPVAVAGLIEIRPASHREAAPELGT